MEPNANQYAHANQYAYAIPLDEVSGAVSTIISSDANKFVFFASLNLALK